MQNVTAVMYNDSIESAGTRRYIYGIGRMFQKNFRMLTFEPKEKK